MHLNRSRKTRIASHFCSILAFAWVTFIGSDASAEFIQFSENNATAHCTEEWTKRGILDQKMFAYCFERQVDGFKELNRLYATNSHYNWIDALLTSKLDKWTKKGVINYEMVAYDVNLEIEGFLDMQYEIDNNKDITQSKIDNCKKKWITNNNPQFSMAVYCMKEDL